MVQCPPYEQAKRESRVRVQLDASRVATGLDAAIAQWIRLRLLFCYPGFKHTIYALIIYSQICATLSCERTKINKKRPGLAHLFKKKVAELRKLAFPTTGVAL